MEKNEEKIEEEIRMLKKERNRERAGHQRRDPKAKRQKMNEDASEEIEPEMRREIEMHEGEKRKICEQEQEGRIGQKRLKRSDIRYFVKNLTTDQAEQSCRGEMRDVQNCGDDKMGIGQNCGDATRPGGPKNGPRGAVVCLSGGVDVCDEIVRKSWGDDRRYTRDNCGHDQRYVGEGCGDANQPGGASNGPRVAVVCRMEGGDDHGDCDVGNEIVACVLGGGDDRGYDDVETGIVSQKCGDDHRPVEMRDEESI